MFLPIRRLNKTTKLSVSGITTIKFDDYHEFSVSPLYFGNNHTYTFIIQNVKGSFEIVQISIQAYVYVNVPFNKESKSFTVTAGYATQDFDFVIDADFNSKYINRIKVKFLFQTADDINRWIPQELLENSGKKNSTLEKIDKYSQTNPIKNESKTSNFIVKKPTLFEIMSDAKYADVVIISFDEVEIYSFRCVLAKYSEVFKNKFEEIKTLPVKIGIKEFNGNIIQAALDFCYGKPDSIVGNETKLFEFANKYKIKELKDACQNYFETNVDIKNVCEFIEIAYANDFGILKQKCQRILAENKNQITPESLKQLSKDILVDIFYA